MRRTLIIIGGIVGAVLLLCCGVYIFNGMVAAGYFGTADQPFQFTAPKAPARATSTPTSELEDILVLEDTGCHRDSVGYMTLTGKVRNTGKVSYTSIRVYGVVGANNLKNDGSSYADSAVLRPGESTTYSILVRDPNPQDTAERCNAGVVDGKPLR